MGASVTKPRYWYELPLKVQKMSHEVAEALLDARWIRYGGDPKETCDGRIEAFIVHPCDFDFFGVGDKYPKFKYIWDDRKYPKHITRPFRIPEEMTPSNIDWSKFRDKCRSRDFSPATDLNDAALIEAAIWAKGRDWIIAYRDALIKIVDSSSDSDVAERFCLMICARPEQRLLAAYQVIVKMKKLAEAQKLLKKPRKKGVSRTETIQDGYDDGYGRASLGTPFDKKWTKLAKKDPYYEGLVQGYNRATDDMAPGR